MPALLTNILLVEDDVPLRKLLTVVLTRSGYRVRAAEDGFSALAEIRANMPDILLSDLYMLGMSGFELLSVVRRRFPAIKVIAMSSAFSGGEVPLGVAADRFYQKATSVPALLHLVEETGTAENREPSLRSGAFAPIWIATQSPMAGPGEPVVIACPECLRTFANTPAKVGSVVHAIQQTLCAHCHTPIHYAIVQSIDPGPPNSVRRPTGLRVTLPLVATLTA
jgi:CheY-like chemotaxis protein